ncbi:MAG: T9SS type A sorting domain-containing protein [Flavobacteriales bacterium]
MNFGFKFIMCALVAFGLTKSGQAQWDRMYDIPVIIGDTAIYNPWAGGINSAQLSTFDANLDGLQDIFVFDRIGSRISIFINMDGTPGAMRYKYTQEYNHVFPTSLRHWVLLRDMNCDGKKDICANTGSGMKVYWNTSESELSFAETSTGAIQAEYDFDGDPYNAGIYSIAPDLPAIDDYDGDGDMDVWSWNDYGTMLFFYKNNAVENGDCSTYDFDCRSRCYGLFGENTESFTLTYGEEFDCQFNVIDPRSESEQMRHTGGTVLTLDLDNNGQKDIVISDVTESNDASLLIMDGTNLVDSVFEVQLDFPAGYGNSQAVNLDKFPGNFYEDVNNDGIKDLIVSPNASSEAEDRFGMWVYLNTGTNSNPFFEFYTDDFLQSEMIEIGTGCFPVSVDVDQDGLNDLVVANRLFYDAINGDPSSMMYFRNTGTISNAAFTLIDSNWLNVSSNGFESVYPAFGDLDADGDMDLVLGEQDGYLHVYTNTAGSGNPSVFELTDSPMIDSNNEDLDVGQLSTPQLVDVNEDGKLDLIIGELNGSVNYYQNVGSDVQYNFQLIEDSIGDAVATSVLGIQGKSVPFMFKDELGLWQLIIGTETGQINHYNTIEGNFLGAFNLVTTDFLAIDEGDRTSVSMGDFNGDSYPELMVGNLGGGLGIYINPGVSTEEIISTPEILVYPNPARDHITLASKSETINEVEIFDASGRIVSSLAQKRIRVDFDLSGLSSGVYTIRVITNSGFVVKRISLIP